LDEVRLDISHPGTVKTQLNPRSSKCSLFLKSN
jgi:hypothetical protein